MTSSSVLETTSSCLFISVVAKATLPCLAATSNAVCPYYEDNTQQSNTNDTKPAKGYGPMVKILNNNKGFALNVVNTAAMQLRAEVNLSIVEC